MIEGTTYRKFRGFWASSSASKDSEESKSGDLHDAIVRWRLERSQQLREKVNGLDKSEVLTCAIKDTATRKGVNKSGKRNY
jgi:hypothetical protein